MPNAYFMEQTAALEAALAHEAESLNEDTVTLANFGDWVIVAESLKGGDFSNLTLTVSFLNIYKPLENALAAAKTIVEYEHVQDLCSQYGKIMREKLSHLAVTRGFYVLDRIMAATERLLCHREKITTLSDMANQETGVVSWNGVAFQDCVVSNGLCAYMLKSLGESSFERYVWFETHELFCGTKGLDSGYPISSGEYFGRVAARSEYCAHPAKWGSNEYGQARWKFVEDYKNYLQGLLDNIDNSGFYPKKRGR